MGWNKLSLSVHVSEDIHIREQVRWLHFKISTEQKVEQTKGENLCRSSSQHDVSQENMLLI